MRLFIRPRRSRGIVQGRIGGSSTVDPGSGSSRAKGVEGSTISWGENIGIGKIVGPFEAFVSEPQEVEAGSVAINKPVPVLLPSALAPV